MAHSPQDTMERPWIGLFSLMLPSISSCRLPIQAICSHLIPLSLTIHGSNLPMTSCLVPPITSDSLPHSSTMLRLATWQAVAFWEAIGCIP
jgi:hypothetical protein